MVLEVYKKAIEEEKIKIPTLVPITAANVSIIYEAEDPLLVYVSQSSEITSNVRNFVEDLKYQYC